MKEACGCGCCAGVEVLTPQSEANRPGLDAIVYRAGTYATFLETMIARLSSLYLDVPVTVGSATTTRVRPLAALTTRDPSDPSIALLDAWAIVADVLTFYQERIANEGYLPTAIERRSIVELAKLIGYRPRPGVAASVYLAFTAVLDFKGAIPRGTRAQSIPGTGESAQYFETSDDLYARDTWNLLAPRVTRPQLITPPATYLNGGRTLPVATGADVVDAVYFAGITTNLKVGDALVFVFSGDADQQFMRQVEVVNAQGDDKRTEVSLVPLLPRESASSASTLLPFADKVTYLFPGSDLVLDVAAILTALVTNIGAAPSAQAADLIRGVISQVRERRDIAVGRGFTRVTAWADHLLRALDLLARFAVLGSLGDAGEGGGEGGGDVAVTFTPSTLAPSPLAALTEIVAELARPASLQPANATRLVRTVAQSFAAQSDTAPRLLKVLQPRAAGALYRAWTKVEAPGNRVEVHAARAKAALFAHNFAGIPTVTEGEPVSFAPPVLKDVLHADDTSQAQAVIPLDGMYDQIKPGSWAVIDRPEVTPPAGTPGDTVPANRTYHRVVATRSEARDAGNNSGFAAKATVLELDPPWLSDVKSTERGVVLGSTVALRGTVLYAQTEPLALVDEPLDTDVQGNTIELAKVYDGLEAGRWIIVSGTRTDIPNVSGVTANELVMIGAVAQGARPPLSVDYPLAGTPFTEVKYTTSANAFGDRLVVGRVGDPTIFANAAGDPAAGRLPAPIVLNQQYRDQVQLAPGVYANAYVPTLDERLGHFPHFEGLLVDPDSGAPFANGDLGAPKAGGLFAWRISSQPLHTVLTLANALAYKYDTRTIKIYGNVVNATHGQTIGEVLGDGDARVSFQTFPLHKEPLTYVSAPTPAGAESTLSVRVNEIEWHEADNVAALGPRDRRFITDTDDDDVVSVIFGDGRRGARLPSGKSNVKATYRYGIGKPGNVGAGQISQLATQPLGVQGVVNPLPASGGADRDTRDQARRNAPLAVTALDRLVSVRDYEDFARGYAGIGKAGARELTDGRRTLVHLTIAGKDDIPIDRDSDLYRNLVASLARFGDPLRPVAVCPRRTKLLMLSAGVRLLPDYAWEAVEPVLRAALLDLFSFDRREIGQAAFLSEAVAALQNVEGVDYVNVEHFDGVAENVTAAQLAALADTLALNKFVTAEAARLNPGAPTSASACERVLPAELVYMTPDVPATLLLKSI